jgi:hypothetical protein
MKAIFQLTGLLVIFLGTVQLITLVIVNLILK